MRYRFAVGPSGASLRPSCQLDRLRVVRIQCLDLSASKLLGLCRVRCSGVVALLPSPLSLL
jgi:hypothetical protein